MWQALSARFSGVLSGNVMETASRNASQAETAEIVRIGGIGG